MSIVKMSHLELLGLAKDKDKILDELYRSGVVHICDARNIVGTEQKNTEEEIRVVESTLERVKDSINMLLALKEVDKREFVRNMKLREFVKVGDDAERLEQSVKTIQECQEKIRDNFNEILRLKRSLTAYLPQQIVGLSGVVISTSEEAFGDTKKRQLLDKIYKAITDELTEDLIKKFGLIKDKKDNFRLEFRIKKEDFDAHAADLVIFNDALKRKDLGDGNIKVTFAFPIKSSAELLSIDREIAILSKQNENLLENLIFELKNLDDLRLYSDWLKYKIDKLRTSAKLRYTKSTFVLECFVPEDKVDDLWELLEAKFDSVVVEVRDAKKDEIVPTLTRNNRVIRKAEFVTNMYSTPRYDEIDPNFTVFVFFMIFFGFIMADIGYGIVITFLGFLLASRQREENGAKRLWSLIGYGGIFTILWGFLFGSFFGFTHADVKIIPQGVMPNPQNDTIVLLLFCLAIGIIQIITGFILRGLNAFKKKRYIDGIVNGFMWALFLTGMVMGVTRYLMDFFKITVDAKLYSVLQAIESPGLIVMISSLAIAVLFAGVTSRGFAKVTKSFSSLYGIINLLSDILSYARLFGLMLSGAIIAQQFNNLGMGLMTSPVGYVLGVIVVLIGHVFNVAMSVLGAYIHDVRLQYIEYFSKFYTGEGVAFEPLNAKFDYVIINDKEGNL